MEHSYPKLSKKLSTETVKMFDKYIANNKISVEIEQGLTAFTKAYCTGNEYSYYPVYIDKRNDLIANMDAKSSIGNKHFVKNVKGKKLKRDGEDMKSFSEIAYMKPHELYPEKWAREIARKSIREEKSKNIATSDMYPCKCGARKALVSCPVQLRSADEPMTTYITCLVCNKVTKI